MRGIKQKSKNVTNILKYFTNHEKIKLFNDCSELASKAKNRSIFGEGLKILTNKQMLQRLLIALAQVIVGNTFENLLNEI